MNFLKARLINKQTSNQRNRHNHTIVKITNSWKEYWLELRSVNFFISGKCL